MYAVKRDARDGGLLFCYLYRAILELPATATFARASEFYGCVSRFIAVFCASRGEK